MQHNMYLFETEPSTQNPHRLEGSRFESPIHFILRWLSSQSHCTHHEHSNTLNAWIEEREMVESVGVAVVLQSPSVTCFGPKSPLSYQ